METSNITFIGAGNMTSALIAGLIAMGYPPEKITASNPSVGKLQALQQQFGIRVSQDNSEAIEDAEIVVFAVKPALVPGVCQELKNILVHNKPIIVSVAAGVSTSSFSDWLDSAVPVVRAMPNTPSAVQAGATGLFANAQVSEAARNQVEALFRSVGIMVWVQKEEEIDLITATSGSGPAYYFLMIESMQDAAVQLGLSEESARLLTFQTILGAAKMAMESQVDVKELRRSITSPNGTTEAAIRVFEEGGIRELFEKAMQAALQRSKELAGGK